MQIKQLLQLTLISLALMLFTACSSGEGINSSNSSDKYSIDYKGLIFYSKNAPLRNYKLKSLSNKEFNNLDNLKQLAVADKLLSTLFYGYPLKEIESMLASGSFLTTVQDSLNIEKIDKLWLESEILDEKKFKRFNYSEQEATDILARFYVADKLDSYFFNNWVAYILTQTIMFSPSYELDSSHSPNIARVYNTIVTLLEDEASMRYITYQHMMSEDNWRRFRSPEDNGREMLEIYTFDMDDSHVPIAAKALQNWKLDRDNDTLVIGLNENTEELSLFNTTIINGDDFYREMVKSNSFAYGVVNRLVSFFFTEYEDSEIDRVSKLIVSSNPKTWQDILKQIVFSKEYLLSNSRAKSAEESFFSLAKKMDFKNRDSSIFYLKENLEEMHQASMKYKLGKLTRVPLDTLSFAVYHKYIREDMLLNHSSADAVDDYSTWSRQGWSDSFVDSENFNYDYEDEEASLESFINYLFVALLSREAKDEEMKMFKNHMLENDKGVKVLRYPFNMFSSRDNRDDLKRNIAFVVLDYISRVDELYILKEVK